MNINHNDVELLGGETYKKLGVVKILHVVIGEDEKFYMCLMSDHTIQPVPADVIDNYEPADELEEDEE